jgi:signal transduction histidine kinase
MRPLDSLPSIKVKLGIVIVAAVAVTTVTIVMAVHLGMPKWLGGLIAVGLGLGMVQVLARGMTSPLREMADAATAMSKGEYGRVVTASSKDEVGDLARAFNKMAAELAEVDRMRRDLVANVSHELRTPISALQAVLENLVDGVEPPDPATMREMLQQTERLSRLVSQLLDLSRLESGASPLQAQWFGVQSVLEGAAREVGFRMPLADRGVTLEVEVEPEDLKGFGDPDRVDQVIANLLENAVRHSPDPGLVRVRATASGDGVQIEVTDEGPGIPAEERARVFERFYRTDEARSAEEGGTGLGLSIAHWIVEQHGGEIRAEEARPHGCRMMVVLPGAVA